MKPGRILGKLVDIFLPHQCMMCRKVVSVRGTLCGACFPKVKFIYDASICAVCGQAIERPYKKGEICAACLYKPPVCSKIRAAFRYDHESSPLVLGLKYGDRTEFCGTFAVWMIRAYGDMSAVDLIVPVPLHPRRLFFRKYNQAAMLAAHIARQAKKDYSPFILKRVRNTKVQGEFNAKGRRRNVRGAFAVAGKSQVEGRHVLVIDDVLTTGATVFECARVLLDAGAKEVSALTLART